MVERKSSVLATCRLLVVLWCLPLQISSFATRSRNRSFKPIFRSAESSFFTSLSSNCFFNDLVDRFQGDFDNYHQFQSDQEQQLQPGEGGGHEHIHATLLPLSRQTSEELTRSGCLILKRNNSTHLTPSTSVHCILAAYYFGGVPSNIFRFRLYVLEPCSEESGRDETWANKKRPENNSKVLLKLYSICPELVSSFRAIADEPTTWETHLDAFCKRKQDQFFNFDPSAGESNGNNQTTEFQLFTELEGCDVLWTIEHDAKRHAYYTGSLPLDENVIDDDSFHAVMINETGPILPSTVNVGKQIRVKDELSLTAHRLWINDRGFDVKTGEFLYGNRRGIPYILDRVATFVTSRALEDDDDEGKEKQETFLSRKLVDEGDGVNLEWTLVNDS